MDSSYDPATNGNYIRFESPQGACFGKELQLRLPIAVIDKTDKSGLAYTDLVRAEAADRPITEAYSCTRDE